MIYMRGGGKNFLPPREHYTKRGKNFPPPRERCTKHCIKSATRGIVI